jgi:hypothetical protein
MTRACDPEQIQRCSDELGDRLPELLTRHEPFALMAALTEHVGSTLFLTQDARICTPETARAIIERVREIAFTERDSL